MRQQIAIADIALPVRKQIGVDRVFGTAVVLQPDAGQIVAHRQQEIVTVVMPRAEQLVGLHHQLAVQIDLLVGRRDRRRGVTDDVEADIVADQNRLRMLARKHRRIDQRIVSHRLIAGAVARHPPAHRGVRSPALGNAQLGRHRNTADIIARRVQRHLLPLQVHQRRRHRPPLDAHGLARIEILEPRLHRGRALRHLDMKGGHVQWIARPGQRLAVRGEAQPRQIGRRAFGRMRAGQPFGVEQHHRPGRRDRDGLGDVDIALRHVARIHLQPHRAGIVPVHRRGNRIGERRRGGGRAVAWRHLRGGGGGEQQRGEGERYAHGSSPHFAVSSRSSPLSPVPVFCRRG